MPITKPRLGELLKKDQEHCCTESCADTCVKIMAVAELPTRFGEFQVIAFYNNEEYLRIKKEKAGHLLDGPVDCQNECRD